MWISLSLSCSNHWYFSTSWEVLQHCLWILPGPISSALLFWNGSHQFILWPCHIFLSVPSLSSETSLLIFSSSWFTSLYPVVSVLLFNLQVGFLNLSYFMLQLFCPSLIHYALALFISMSALNFRFCVWGFPYPVFAVSILQLMISDGLRWLVFLLRWWFIFGSSLMPESYLKCCPENLSLP